MKYPYFLEIWLRGYAKDKIREISNQDSEKFHPHITLARPFKILKKEKEIITNITNFCKNYQPILYSLEGKSNFNGKYHHIPITNKQNLLQFANGLEKLLKPNVMFTGKPENKTNLHATVNYNEGIPAVERIDQYMLRLTGIKNKKIWFSYDFITKETLNRTQSLDKSKWYKTIHEFTKQTELLPTRQGFQKID